MRSPEDFRRLSWVTDRIWRDSDLDSFQLDYFERLSIISSKKPSLIALFSMIHHAFQINQSLPKEITGIPIKTRCMIRVQCELSSYSFHMTQIKVADKA